MHLDFIENLLICWGQLNEGVSLIDVIEIEYPTLN